MRKGNIGNLGIVYVHRNGSHTSLSALSYENDSVKPIIIA